ncbi:hypothetical protein J7J13_02845 [bacterium]|nr:hypothetical protein [bacterium]
MFEKFWSKISGTNKADIRLVNQPKDERLKVFRKMKSFAHYIGFAGERLVMAELLLRGVNVAKPLVDDGADILAVREGAVFSVQVKTAFRNTGKNRWMFNVGSLQKSPSISLLKKRERGIVFVFVLIENAGEPYNFLIVPFSEVKKQAKANNIYYHKSTDCYRANVYLREGKVSLGDLKNDVTEFLNAWELLGAEKKKRKYIS